MTISNVLPTLAVMNKRLKKRSESDLTNSLREAIGVYMNTNYAEESTQAFLQKCTFLDPRFKQAYTERSALDVIIAEAQHVCGETGEGECLFLIGGDLHMYMY